LSEQGKANYEGFHHGERGYAAWDSLTGPDQHRWDRGAFAVTAHAADGNGPATVIVVTEDTGRERRYDADGINVDDGALVILRGSPIASEVAAYAPRRWLCAFKETVPAPGEAQKLQVRLGDVLTDLGTALRALRQIRDSYPPGHAGRDAAHAALDAIGYDDTDDEDTEEDGCACYTGPDAHEHDSDEDGDCRKCGCGQHSEPIGADL
jgi:hypothetical protein